MSTKSHGDILAEQIERLIGELNAEGYYSAASRLEGYQIIEAWTEDLL
jgi:hypothetical protein